MLQFCSLMIPLFVLETFTCHLFCIVMCYLTVLQLFLQFFLLHERKFECVHDTFTAFIRKELPSLSDVTTPIPIVSDDERGICNAIDRHLTGVVRVSCWNHIINAAKVWLRKHEQSLMKFQCMYQICENCFINQLTRLTLRNMYALKGVGVRLLWTTTKEIFISRYK